MVVSKGPSNSRSLSHHKQPRTHLGPGTSSSEPTPSVSPAEASHKGLLRRKHLQNEWLLCNLIR